MKANNVFGKAPIFYEHQVCLGDRVASRTPGYGDEESSLILRSQADISEADPVGVPPDESQMAKLERRTAPSR